MKAKMSPHCKLSTACKKMPFPNRKEGRPSGESLAVISATVPEAIADTLKYHPTLVSRPMSHHIERAVRIYLKGMGIEV